MRERILQGKFLIGIFTTFNTLALASCTQKKSVPFFGMRGYVSVHAGVYV